MQHDMQVEMDPNQAYSGSEKAKAKEINKLMRQQNESLAKAQEYEEQKTKILQKLVKESEKQLEKTQGKTSKSPKNKTPKPKVDVRPVP